MKKLLSLAVCAVMLCLVFASCGSSGPLDGTYSCDLKIGDTPFSELTFDGDEVTCKYLVNGDMSKGTYELKDGKVICNFTYHEEDGVGSDETSHDTYDYDAETDTLSLSTMKWTKN